MNRMEGFELDDGTTASRVREFLAFRLDREEYGIDILNVQEIRGCDAVTRIADAPAFIQGIINLRGMNVPIIDLRVKFALSQASFDAFTVVLVLKVQDKVVGAVVDSVSEVLELDDRQIEREPAPTSTPLTPYVTGVATVESFEGQRTLTLIDIGSLIAQIDLPSPI
jgi:purine-binding chemotaxis protein CheW